MIGLDQLSLVLQNMIMMMRKEEQRYIGGYKNNDNDDKHCAYWWCWWWLCWGWGWWGWWWWRWLYTVQAELDKRESQWAQAVDTLKLRSCEEQVLFFLLFSYVFQLGCCFILMCFVPGAACGESATSGQMSRSSWSRNGSGEIIIADFPAVFFHIFNFDICHEIQIQVPKVENKSQLSRAIFQNNHDNQKSCIARA